MAKPFRRVGGALLVVALSVTVAAVTAGVTARPALTASTAQVVVRPTPNVLRAVRDLARLETVTFHMERVIDLHEEQSHAFGLVHAEDAILLVAVGEVIAGVDLAALRPEDVVVDPAKHRVSITLPRAQIFVSHLDSEHTRVHSRSTDLLARRNEGLETRARQEAERSIALGATESGILDRARQGAERTVGSLARSLGFTEVEVRSR